ILENPSLIKATGLAIVAVIVAVEIGLLNRILETVSLTIDQWLICVVVSLGVLVVAEGAKLLHVRTDEEPAVTAATQVAAA
ncbi:MAG TPA: cation transporting ATPase C-terminal domain-containing protein, partial [Candidatus Limnocylindrales bacterium]|nr:cation transporting ATPase C-terminal domain-containing protein [Candidatus Limnocylindrales bacterium]